MRVKDWKNRLEDVILTSQHIEFEYGKNDCLIFASKCYEAVTGESFDMPEYDKRSMYREMKERGYESYKDVIFNEYSKYTESEPLRGALAQEGDIVYMENEELPMGAALGVCIGRKCIFLTDMKDTPYIYFDIDKINFCWRVN